MSDRRRGDISYRMYADYGYDPEITRRMHRPYVEHFRGCRDVLDVGCGRGEFLELLAAEGISAQGVDEDPEQVADDVARGLPVQQGDGRGFLSAHKEDFDGIFAAHVLEHMVVEEARALIVDAYRALRPGGRLVLVVPNVASVGMHLDFYYRDFTHRVWAHPAVLSFLCRDAGFVSTQTGENEEARYPYLGEAVQLYMKAEWELSVLVQEQGGEEAASQGTELARLSAAAHRLARAGRSVVDRLDRPFEAWVRADKGATP